jgi:hypothetical protein
MAHHVPQEAGVSDAAYGNFLPPATKRAHDHFSKIFMEIVGSSAYDHTQSCEPYP